MNDPYAIIKIEDNKGFIYEVVIRHTPQHGFSTAYHNGSIIAQCSYGRMLQPTSDDDREWEEWEERFNEWTDAAISDLKLSCKEYFNNSP